MAYNIEFWNSHKKDWQHKATRSTLADARTYAKGWPSMRILIVKEETIEVIEPKEKKSKKK